MADTNSIPAIFKGGSEVLRMYRGSNLVYSSGDQAFVSIWKTDNPGVSDTNQVTLPLESDGVYNFEIDWGDGSTDTITTFNQPEVTHTYPAPGTYTISILGSIQGWRFNDSGDKDKILEIQDFGDLRLGNNGAYFSGCSNLTISATNALRLSGTTNLSFAFANCTSLTNASSLVRWSTGQILTMNSMFAGAENFNENLNRWNVENVLDMRRMFEGATSFNQTLNGWDPINVNDMSFMFYNAETFNSDISLWDVGKVTTMNSMFRNAGSFNQPLNSWDVANVVDMSYMFENAESFNQSLLSWDTTRLQSARYMFKDATSYNQNMDQWQTATFLDLEGMFQNATAFNGDITRWNMRNVENFSYMFQGATSFNRSVGSWDTNSAVNMDYMFNGATSFNQALNGWITNNVTSMTGMFRNAKSFEGNGIDNWDISGLDSVTSMALFASGETSYTTKNYDAHLIYWSAGADLGLWFNNLAPNFGQTKYSSVAAAQARQNLINYGWTITDGGQEEFVSVWTTDNVGTSADNQITLPLTNIGTYNFEVEWGDGNTNTITAFDQAEVTHTYASAGTYTVTIRGDIEGFNFQQGGDQLKLIEIQEFGPLNPGVNTSAEGAFSGCSNLSVTATDAIDLEGVTSIANMFSNCTSLTSFPSLQIWDVSAVQNMSGLFSNCINFNEDVSMWNTQSVTNMSFMFDTAVLFDQNLGSWDVKDVTTMENMFNGVTLSTTNYEGILIGWASQALESDVTFDAGNSQYQTLVAEEARNDIIATYNWTINDGGKIT